MKKLTAGIFSALLGIVAVGAADAKIATDGYVTGITGDKAGLTGQAAGKANLVEAINVKADSSTVGELNTAVQQNVSDISGLTSTVGTHTTALETLNADATNENSVAGKISAALTAGDFASKTEAQGYATAAQGNAKDYTDQQVSALTAEGGAVKVLEGKVNTLEGTVGDASSGLVKSVADNAQAITNLDTTYVSEEELQALDADKTANAGSYISGVKQEDGVITGITETAFDNALSATSTNAVQNKVVDAKFVEVEGSLNGKITAPSTVDETGTLVLTAKYDTATQSYTYQWESITGRE